MKENIDSLKYEVVSYRCKAFIANNSDIINFLEELRDATDKLAIDTFLYANIPQFASQSKKARATVLEAFALESYPAG